VADYSGRIAGRLRGYRGALATRWPWCRPGSGHPGSWSGSV